MGSESPSPIETGVLTVGERSLLTSGPHRSAPSSCTPRAWMCLKQRQRETEKNTRCFVCLIIFSKCLHNHKETSEEDYFLSTATS